LLITKGSPDGLVGRSVDGAAVDTCPPNPAFTHISREIAATTRTVTGRKSTRWLPRGGWWRWRGRERGVPASLPMAGMGTPGLGSSIFMSKLQSCEVTSVGRVGEVEVEGEAERSASTARGGEVGLQG